MPAAGKREDERAERAEAGSLDALAEAVESGAGLPAVARAAAKVLDASVALIDRSIQKGVLHENAAARHKSRLTKLVNSLAAGQAR